MFQSGEIIEKLPKDLYNIVVDYVLTKVAKKYLNACCLVEKKIERYLSWKDISSPPSPTFRYQEELSDPEDEIDPDLLMDDAYAADEWKRERFQRFLLTIPVVRTSWFLVGFLNDVDYYLNVEQGGGIGHSPYCF